MKLSSLELGFETIANDTKCMLIEIQKNNEYVDGKATGNQNGWKYICILVKNGYEKVTIKVENNECKLTPEVFTELEKQGNVWIKPIGFVGKLYQNGNSVLISAKAKDMQILKGSN